jgi:hypothetical protein
MGLFDPTDTSSQDYLKQALAAYTNAAVPTTASETVSNLPQETVQGAITPQQIQAVNQTPSAYNNIALDPATRAAQMSALGQYTDIANSGGLDANAKLALQEGINATNQQSQGAQGAIQQQAQAEGQGGGDFALTQRAIAAQGASNAGALQGQQAAAEAEANREAALNQMSNIGGSVNAADYSQAANKAASTNTINAANTGYANAANVGNVANNLTGQTTNLGVAQGVNAANTAANQGQVYYNANLPQQQFNNELSKANGIAGVSSQQAGAAQNAANNQNAMTGSLIGAAGTVAGAAMGGPAGAAIGGTLAKTAAQPKGTAMPVNAANGGYTCYADGGVAHDHGICMKMGGHVGGEAKVEGDSETNDTVPALLSPGELVIPRSVPKDGAHMEEFARKAPIAGDKKKVDLTSFTNGYKRGK